MSDDRLFPSERDLDAFWNALVRGEDRLDAAGPNRDEADQLRRLHSLLRATPPAGADERLRRGVMAELARHRHLNEMETSMNGLALGARPAAPLVPPRPIVLRPARPRWWERGASIIGVAALIVAMIGGIFFTFHGSPDTTLPAVIASPTANPAATPATPAAWVPPTSLWTADGGAQAFRAPSAIAIDPSGNLWVNDRSNTFQIFDANGKYVETWGAEGSGDGQFNFLGPHQNLDGGIVFGQDGGFYVLDTGNLRVQKFDRDRRFVSAWGAQGSGPGQFIAPVGLAIDAQGHIYVEDELRDDVQIFDGGGTLLRSFRVHASFGINPGEPDTANGVAVDKAGNVYVTSILMQSVLKFDPSGKFLARYGRGGLEKGQFLQPGMVAFDDAGHIFVTDVDNNRVVVLDQNGRYLADWGQERRAPDTVTGPAGIAIQGGFVYLVEIKGNRLHAFRLPSSFPTPSAPATPAA